MKAKYKYSGASSSKEKRRENDAADKESVRLKERIKYRRSRLYKDFAEEISTTDIEFSERRTTAFDAIKGHVIGVGKKAKFGQVKGELIKGRSSVYLPDLPSEHSRQIKRGLHTSKVFLRSRSQSNWLTAASNIFMHFLADANIDQVLNQWFPSVNLQRKTERFKRYFVATQLSRRTLNVRNLWIRTIYSAIHKANLLSEEILNKDSLDVSVDKSPNQILGLRKHQKGHEAYFPTFSYTDGKKFAFKYDAASKKSSETVRESEWCKKTCIPATSVEIINFYRLLNTCKSLDVRNGRKFIQDLNECGNLGDPALKIYKLINDKRNHPEECYMSGDANKCESLMVELRRLSVHYQNARSIYRHVNALKVADLFVNDLDTATSMGDLDYLIKLLNFKPHYAVKTFNLERPETIINEATVNEMYGEHYTTYLRDVSLLPTVPCVSCNKLITEDSKTITSRWGKPKQPGSQYMRLLQYRQSEEYIRKGGTRLDTLIGSKICGYCWGKMDQKGEVPGTSLINGMDIGTTPDEIKRLNMFETLLIKQYSHFQVMLKLGPTVGNRPNNEKMKAMKGFSVHIPVPVQQNVKKLGDDRPNKLIDPKNYILLHGLPTIKDKKVWTSLINVEKVLAALKWLIEHNARYDHIQLPTNLAEFLQEMNSQLEGICESQLGSSLNVPLDDHDEASRDPTRSQSLSDASAASATLPDLLVDTYSQNSEAESSHGSEVSSNEPTAKATKLDSSDSQISHDLPSASGAIDAISPDSEVSYDLPPASGTIDPDFNIIGGLKSNDDNVLEFEGLMQFLDVEHPELKAMWDTAVTVTDEEMVRIRATADTNMRRKLVTLNCIKSMCRLLLSNATLCGSCFVTNKQFRAKLTDMADHDFQLFDQSYLNSVFKQLRGALHDEAKCILKNRCSLCASTLKHSKFLIATAKRNNQKVFTKSPSASRVLMDFDAKSAHAMTIDVLTNIDELKESAALCRKCHTGMESSVKRVIPHYYKASFRNRMKAKWHAETIASLNDKSLALQELAKLQANSTQIQRCVKCKRVSKAYTQLLSAHVDTAKAKSEVFGSSPNPEDDDVAYVAIGNRREMGPKKDTASFVTSFPCSYRTHKEAKLNKSENKVLVTYILDDFSSAKRLSRCCATCNDDVKSTKLIFTNLLKSKFGDKYLSLKSLDKAVLLYLHLYYSDKLAASKENNICFHCSKTLPIVDVRGGADDGSKDSNTPHMDSASSSPQDRDDARSPRAQFSDLDLSDLSDFSNLSDFDNLSESDSLIDENDGLDLSGAGSGLITPTTDNQATTEDENAPIKTQKAMLEEMTSDDLKNMLEEYTVTGMGQSYLDDSPELMDDMYRLLRLDDEAVEFEDNNLDLLAFPEIFSWGTGGKRTEKEDKAMPLQYEKTRLLSANASSRRHLGYLFHLSGECERRKIRQSVFATIKNTPGLGALNAGSVLAKIRSKDPKLLTRMRSVLRLVPNTKAYWASQRAKLKAQIQKFGPPTFFLTFSPAEYNWEDLIRWLREKNSDVPNVNELTPAALMNIDPVLTSMYIHNRFNALWKFILNAKPLGEVVSYFIRHEYQSRGTVHFHTFLWTKDAPIIGQHTDEKVVDFIQKHITCRRPNPTEEATLFDIVGNYQNHVCRGSYCLKTFKGKSKGSKVACRFGFPRNKTKRFVLHEVESSVKARKKKQMRQRLYDLPRSEEERRINDYNGVLSFLWNGNMDIQFLSESSYSICEYVTKYICKPEEAQLKDLAAGVKDGSKSVYQNHIKHAYALLKSREMGAHEAADRIFQNNGQLWRSSEKFQWVQTTIPKHRSRTLKHLKELENKEESYQKVFHDDWVHVFYPNRPRTADFEDMSLNEFVSMYDKVSPPTGGAKEEDSSYLKIYEDGVYIRTLKKRPKEPVIYHHYYSQYDQPELFYYSMLSLYKPWRLEADIKGESASYEAEYFRAIEVWPKLKEMSSRRINIENARKRMEERADEIPDDPNGDNEDGDELEGLRQGVTDFLSVNRSSPIKTEEQLVTYVSTLNEDQRRVYDEVTEKVLQVIDHKKKNCEEDTCECKKPLLLYVSGYGGTGKSYLIQALQGFIYVQKNVFGEEVDIALSAPTGLAARNILGQTLHGLFCFIVEHGSKMKYSELSHATRQQLRFAMKDLMTLVIDEVSMVSNSMLQSIFMRMQQLFGSKELFGGKCVVLFGDLLQLAPVRGDTPYTEMTSEAMHELCGGIGVGMNLWEHFQFRELTINQRQAGSKNILWSNLLGRIRLGVQTQEDIMTLQSRVIPLTSSDLPKEYLDQITDAYLKIAGEDRAAICLMPLREMVNSFNDAVLKKLWAHSYIEVVALDEVDGKTKKDRKRAQEAVNKIDKLLDSRKTANLEKKLLLCKGVRIMLRKNLDTANGLVNGSMGTVVGFVRAAGSETVTQVSVQFDDVPGVVNISRDSGKVQIYAGCFLRRNQFPIVVGYSTTIHKAQGMSLQTVVCDLGKQIFTTGQVYVALSRCRSLQGLHLINFDAAKIMVDQTALREYVRLGSTPVKAANANRDQPLQEGEKRKRRQKQVSERIWYNTSNVRKARSTIKDVIDETVPQPPTPKSKPKRGRGKEKKEPNKKPRPAVIQPRPTVPALIVQAQCVQRIQESIPMAYWPWVSIVTINGLNTVYKDVLVPYSKLVRRGQPIGSLMLRMGKELNPDPFNLLVNDHTSKWLTGECILNYLYVLRDDLVADGGHTIYNMGPYGWSSFNGPQGGQMDEFLDRTFGMRPFCRDQRLVLYSKLVT